jgi:hypothetical protein
MPKKSKKIKQKQKQKQQQTVIINIGREKNKTRRRKYKSPDKKEKEYIQPAIIPPIMVNPQPQSVPNQSQPIPLAFQQPVPLAFQQQMDIPITESQPVGIETSQSYEQFRLRSDEEPAIVPPISKKKVEFQEIENPNIIFPDIEEETKSGQSATEASDVERTIKRRGRPKGSKNKYKSTRGVEQPYTFQNPRIPFMSDPLGMEDIPADNPFYSTTSPIRGRSQKIMDIEPMDKSIEEDSINLVDSMNVYNPEADTSLIRMIDKVNSIRKNPTVSPVSFQRPPSLSQKKKRLVLREQF